MEIPSLEQLTFDEINAILVHKWYLSEKARYDVGMEFAKNDFFRNHSRAWRQKKMHEDVVRQKEEILRHKWYLSEKLGYDVGIQKAALDWILCGYAEHWRCCTGPYEKKRKKCSST
ncbi:MAG: DUF4032 domain-containing protein [Elusimicrobiota bacterium]